MFSTEIILQCLFMRRMNIRMNNITSQTGINRKTLYRWYSKYNNDITKLLDKKRSHFLTNSRLIIPELLKKDIKNTHDVLKLLNDFINKYPNVNKHNMKSYFKSTFNINISLNTLSKYLKRLNITKKKISKCVVRNTSYLDELILKRKAFSDTILKMKSSDLIFLDETCINEKSNLSMFGYSKKGTNIHLPICSLYGKKSNILMAMTEKSILDFNISNSAYNSATFITFLEKLCLKNPNKVIVCDNVAFHKTKTVLEVVKKYNCSMLFLPPYSPNMNPIENIFSKLKSIHKNNYVSKVIQLRSKSSFEDENKIKNSVECLIKYCKTDNNLFLKKSVYHAIHHNS